MRAREACPRLSPAFDWIIGISAIGYAVCTVLTVPALAQIDWTKLDAKTLFSGPMLVLAIINTIYSGVWVVLAAAWMIWFAGLFNWAKARGVELPDKALAIACWFIPFVNFVHPFTTMRKIAIGTGTKTPLAWWWGMTWVSVILASGALVGVVRGGYDPLFTIASILEISAVLLCWLIVRDFTVADRQWDPRAQLALRG